MERNKVRWGIWRFTICSACSSALREQLSSSNRCSMLIDQCNTWGGAHQVPALKNHLYVTAKTDSVGHTTYGWKLSNTSRRRVLKLLEETRLGVK